MLFKSSVSLSIIENENPVVRVPLIIMELFLPLILSVFASYICSTFLFLYDLWFSNVKNCSYESNVVTLEIRFFPTLGFAVFVAFINLFLFLFLFYWLFYVVSGPRISLRCKLKIFSESKPFPEHTRSLFNFFFMYSCFLSLSFSLIFDSQKVKNEENEWRWKRVPVL